MNHMIIGMKKTLSDLNTWDTENPDTPDIIKQAIRHYRCDLNQAIKHLQEPPFGINDRVELTSSSYEDSGHYSEDTGFVIDIKSNEMPDGLMEHEILVVWDDGSEDCWIDARDFTHA
ncbi:hypothetical protein [Paenibacillus aceti]|uniref:Uncharacterized protein n=1 Tax=Paenibacillus aceti TaxID=1820010 RepID=A0ABQ1VPQ7_9BACL|nr:hypothetical protein [Paenibacillus aceti]GGF86693.1 hypothetical protein GCM10010913_05250 [Paenibacillus aceti]